MLFKRFIYMAAIFMSFEANAEEVNLQCKGVRKSNFVASLNGPDIQNIVLTKENGKVVKAVNLEFKSTYTLKMTNISDKSAEPLYQHLIVEGDRIIMRTITSDGAELDAIIHNSGKFDVNAGFSRVSGQCETKQKLF